jgi:hypothetical protein
VSPFAAKTAPSTAMRATVPHSGCASAIVLHLPIDPDFAGAGRGVEHEAVVHWSTQAGIIGG